MRLIVINHMTALFFNYIKFIYIFLLIHIALGFNYIT